MFKYLALASGRSISHSVHIRYCLLVRLIAALGRYPETTEFPQGLSVHKTTVAHRQHLPVVLLPIHVADAIARACTCMC